MWVSEWVMQTSDIHKFFLIFSIQFCCNIVQSFQILMFEFFETQSFWLVSRFDSSALTCSVSFHAECGREWTGCCFLAAGFGLSNSSCQVATFRFFNLEFNIEFFIEYIWTFLFYKYLELDVAKVYVANLLQHFTKYNELCTFHFLKMSISISKLAKSFEIIVADTSYPKTSRILAFSLFCICYTCTQVFTVILKGLPGRF